MKKHLVWSSIHFACCDNDAVVIVNYFLCDSKPYAHASIFLLMRSFWNN